jgi:hypothetical protein
MGLMKTERDARLMASGRPSRSKMVPRGAGISTTTSWMERALTAYSRW